MGRAALGSARGGRTAGGKALILLVCACAPHGGRENPGRVVFRDVASAWGVEFHHENGATGRRYLTEIMGSGGAILDYDGDGLPDLYLVQGGPIGEGGAGSMGNRLFRNLGSGSFEDRTDEARVGDEGYGMGCAFGDVDGDGDVDLYVTNFGPNVLYRNEGDGTFRDVSVEAGVADPGWGTSCAFFDYDGDGDLDLYVVNYLDFTYATHRKCFDRNHHVYCSPDVYEGQADRLYRNRGNGTFEEVAGQAGLYRKEDAKGLGVVAGDFDGNGYMDVYVANDRTPNYLFFNRGDGSFAEAARDVGVAYNENGIPGSGMGVDASDVNGDGRLDLIVTNYQWETNTLYFSRPEGYWIDFTAPTGLAPISSPVLGFGVLFLDHDNDGDSDLCWVNGHVLDNIGSIEPGVGFAQRNQLLENLGAGVFEDVTARSGPAFRSGRVSRGLAKGDLDQDGDLDLLVTQNGGPAEILENIGGNGAAWLRVRLVEGGRSAVGGRCHVSIAGRRQVQELLGGSSYLSQSEPVLHFGLGDAAAVEEAEIVWPGGERLVLERPPARRELVVIR